MNTSSSTGSQQSVHSDNGLAAALDIKRRYAPEAVCRFYGPWDMGRCVLVSQDFAEYRGKTISGWRIRTTGKTLAAALVAAVKLAKARKAALHAR